MNVILSVQVLAQKELPDQDFRNVCNPLVSMLDALSETLCHKTGTSRFYHPAELIDAQHRALRWHVVLSLGKERLSTLQEFLSLFLSSSGIQVPFCTLQWKIE
ncbi:MAG: hypothetical protein IKT87_07525 [Bacteroidaceae bacterium]|nr:hypothetical protein [Bacteroidaceae bacterium]